MTALLTPPTPSTAATAALPLVLEPPRHLDLPPVLLTPGHIRLGSGADCQVRLVVDGIAAEHATLLVGTHRTILRSIDPRTWLNDGPARETAIRPGDRIALGPLIFRIRRATADDLLAGWPAPPTPVAAPAASIPAPHTPLVTAPTLPPEELTQEIEPEPAPVAVTEPETLVVVEEVTEDPAHDDPPVLDFDPTLIATAIGPAATDDITAGWTDTPSTSTVHPAVADITTDIVETLVEQRPALPPLAEALAELQRQQSDLIALRQQLADARAAFREETLRREAQLAEEAARLSRQSTDLVVSLGEFDERDRQLRLRAKAIDDRDEVLRAAENALAAREQELAAERNRLATVAETTRRELQTEVARQSAEWANWEHQQQQLLAQVAEQSTALDEQRAAIVEQQRRLDAAEYEHRQLRRDLEQQRQELGADRERLAADSAAFAAERQAWSYQRDREQEEHRTRERDLKQLEQEVRLRSEHVRRQQDQLALDIRERARSHAELQAIEQQLHRDRRLLSDQQANWHQERESAWQDIAERRKRLDAEADRLQAARHEIERLERALEAEIQAAARDRHRWEDELQSLGDRGKLALDEPVALAPSPVAAAPATTAESFLPGSDVVRVIDPPADLITEFTPSPVVDESATISSVEEDVPTEVPTAADTLTEVDDVATVDDSAAADEVVEEPTDIDDSSREEIQAALDALAERFEEFSVLEHRLSLKHDELRTLQEDLAVREAALDAEREALGLERATWEGERSLWEDERATWEAQANEFESFQTAWEIARQAQQADLFAERRRWAAHLAELVQDVSAFAARSMASPSTEHVTIAEPVADRVVEPVPESLVVESAATDSAFDEPPLIAAEAVAPEPTLLAEVETPPADELPLTDALSTALGRCSLEPPPLPTEAVSASETPASEESTWFGQIPDFEPEDEKPRLRSVARSLDPAAIPVADTLLQSLGLADVASIAPPVAEPEASLDPEPPAAHGLRSELAKMFDLPDDFARPHEEDAEPAADSALEAVLQESATEPEPAADDWRSQLTAALAAAETAPQVADAPVTPPPVPQPTAAEEPQLSEEDSIAAYMERLLARSRQRTGEPEPVAPPPAPESVSEGLPTASPVEETADGPTDVVKEPLTPRTKIDVEATRAELQSFRAVANQSARSALAVHTLKTTRTELWIQIALLLASVGGAAFLFSTAWRGTTEFVWPGAGCVIAAGLLTYRVTRSWLRLRRWRAEAAPAIKPQSESEGAPTLASSEATEPPPAVTDSSVAESPVVANDVTMTVPMPRDSFAATPAEPSSPPTLSGSLWDSVWADSPTDDDAPSAQ